MLKGGSYPVNFVFADTLSNALIAPFPYGFGDPCHYLAGPGSVEFKIPGHVSIARAVNSCDENPEPAWGFVFWFSGRFGDQADIARPCATDKLPSWYARHNSIHVAIKICLGEVQRLHGI